MPTKTLSFWNGISVDRACPSFKGFSIKEAGINHHSSYFFICLTVFFRKDSFPVNCTGSLGRLNKIRIGHDNTGFGAAWFLDKVIGVNFTFSR